MAVPDPRRHATPAQVLALLLSFLLASGVGGIVVAGLLMPGVAAARTATDSAEEVLEDLPAHLERRPLSQRSTMLAADGTALAEFFAENRVVVPLADVAQHLRDAVVATEDRRFFQHGGVDPAGMLRAVVRNQLGDDGVQGGSTLTQQYVKNVLVDRSVRDGDAESARAASESHGTAGYARKLREARLAIALEKELSKNEILEAYLNIAPFGAGIYGVESAAQRYFSKPAADLDLVESATIAGITQSPTALDPTRHPEATQQRRDTVLMLLRDQEYITPAEHDAAVATPLADTLHVSEARSGCMSADEVVAGSGFFCDYVAHVIRHDPAFGETPEEREDLLYRGGLVITTTLDPRLQTLADEEVKRGVPVEDRSGVGSAMSVVQPGSGKILAMAQNRVFDNTAEAADRHVSVNYNTSYSYGGSGGFAPGSTFKPFTLLEWLRQGKGLERRVDGTPRTVNTNQFTACGSRLSSQSWRVGNAEGAASGTMTVREATRRSVNLAYVSMAMELDLCDIMDGAADLGVTQSSRAREGEPFDAFAANVLGSDSTTPLALAGAYAAFAADGLYCAPIAITRVQDRDGAELPVPDAGCRQAIDPQVAAQLNDALGGVWQGTGRELGTPSYPAAGKTGTTSRNEQTWFVGYTPRLAAATWAGYPDSFTPMQNVVVDGKRIRYVYGATLAGASWKRFMDQALADGEPNPGFAAPSRADATGTGSAAGTVPSVIGQDEASAVAAIRDAGFEPFVAGSTSSTLPAGTVATQSRIGSADPGTTVTLYLSRG
ncbi:penicillin-binding protein [Cellulomonas triticagri]|uniref:PASTA domain-containing protein n=1 Tax=Cellulomonas triticagri TaxID=2483352 RepID=A0A3M2JIZ3_9CELL|nr:penicillin-binding protein [Cellulomonas triticagri]RMI13639.1 PASTA domain-containing protein [Cellulomonas triticagri]